MKSEEPNNCKKVTIEERFIYFIVKKEFNGIIYFLNKIRKNGVKITVEDYFCQDENSIISAEDFVSFINKKASQTESFNIIKEDKEETKPTKEEPVGISVNKDDIVQFVKTKIEKNKMIKLKEVYEKFEEYFDRKEIYNVFSKYINTLKQHAISFQKISNGVYIIKF